MKPLPRWLVRTPYLVDGLFLRFFHTRAEQRAFAKQHNGQCYEVLRSKK